MTRARKSAGLTLDEAAEMASRFMLTTGSTISRMENREEIPTGHKSAAIRQRAYILCLVYEVDPACLGLGPDDLVAEFEIPPRTPGGQRKASTIWYAPKAA
jgi:transcriptional regulator with XRE-family HTH domain